jgi:uncharacterized protein (TIGR03083 family)
VPRFIKPSTTHIDCGARYEQGRLRVCDLVRSLTHEQLATNVPATPAWTVRDVIAHLVGIAADLNAQVIGSDDPDDWTDRQVRSRQGRPVADVLVEWDREAPRFEDGLRLFGYELGAHFIGDLLQHESDIRHALGLHQIPDDELLAIGFDHYLLTFDRALRSGGLGSVWASTERGRWHLGTGSPVASVHASSFDLFRCLGGRRTWDEVRALDWEGPVEPLLDAVSPYPLPTRPIDD